MNSSPEQLSAFDKKRIQKDCETVMAMAKIYCHDHNHPDRDERGLCKDCAEVVDYSAERTWRCPQLHKGACDDCSIQCYRSEMREKIRTIMAYSGPRMMFHHPIMAVRHLSKKLKR